MLPAVVFDVVSLRLQQRANDQLPEEACDDAHVHVSPALVVLQEATELVERLFGRLVKGMVRDALCGEGEDLLLLPRRTLSFR